MTEPVEIKSIVYHYAVDLYDLLVKRAKYVEPAELVKYGWPDTSEQALVYYGNVSTVADQMGLSRNVRTKVSSLLSTMKCMIKLHSGGGHSSGVYVLIQEPTEQMYHDYRASTHTITASLAPTQRQLIIRDVRELQRRVGHLEQQLAELQKGRPKTNGHHL